MYKNSGYKPPYNRRIDTKKPSTCVFDQYKFLKTNILHIFFLKMDFFLGKIAFRMDICATFVVY